MDSGIFITDNRLKFSQELANKLRDKGLKVCLSSEYKEDNKEIYYNYVLKLPDFSKKEDVEKLKSGQIDDIYNEYKKSIIDEKISN